MKKYIISHKAKENTVKVEDKQKKNTKVNRTAIEIAELYLKFKYPISFSLIREFFIIPQIYDYFALKDIIVIKDAKTLKEYRNLSGKQWIYEVKYKEHPLIPKALILSENYSDYLKFDLLTDILNFVLERYLVKNIIIALTDERSASIGMTVPVSEVNPSAKLKVDISKKFKIVLDDTQEIIPNSNHYWIESGMDFSALKTALDSKAQRFEYIVSLSSSQALNFGIADKAELKGKHKKKYAIYIAYTLSDRTNEQL